MNRFLSDDDINQLMDQCDDRDSDIESDITVNSEHNSESELDLDSDNESEKDGSNNGLNIQSNRMSSISSNVSATQSTTVAKTKTHNIFRSNTGPKVKSYECETPLETFRLFLDNKMLSLIVNQTNQKINKQEAQKTIDNPMRKRVTTNQLTDEKEMLAYIGLCFMIGVSRSSHENVNDLLDMNGRGRGIFRAVMPLKRFQYLTEHLCFDHIMSREARKDAGDKLALFSEMFKIFHENCRKNYELSEFVTIDEYLRGFHGKVSFKQYMPKKPAKYGLKLFPICDAKTAYCWDALFYTGKDSNASKNMHLAQKIVTDLTKPLRNTGRNITTDNRFTSFPLARELLLNNLTLLGTLKKNKKEIPKDLIVKKKRDLGSSEFRDFDNNSITLVAYYPKKNKSVVLLSTMHSERQINTDSGKPQIIEDYNKTKGGVDTLDQLCSNYSTGRATKRWPTAAFFALIDIMGVNSYIIFNHFQSLVTPEPIQSRKRREFIYRLGEELSFPLMLRRLDTNTLTRDLRINITKILKNNGKDPIEDPNRVTLAANCSHEKRRKLENANQTRCYLCPRKENKKCTLRCQECDQLICKDKHMVYTCIQCSNKEYSDNN